ncbi:MAG: UDP-N-acetylmuramoyl-tripeptide--D-alanyl-D-alanine ligase [Lachnospiraceae bacterium]|nr:UDP-N-acetylmuramoyl-tripeptide--D-alanyl-D-alanine ligase [Lachnospiraceae bacterium]
MDLTIKEIACACGGTLFQQGTTEDMQISGLELDSRKVAEGGVFLATVGERVDGHQFILDVFQKGVSLVICEKSPEQVEAEHGLHAKSWGSYLLVKDCFQALKDIAEYYRSKLQIPVVGITGSVGKTSTKEFIATVLGEHFSVLKTEGNYNNEVGVPLTLLRIRREHQAAVIEMGISDFGEMHRLSKMVRPSICVITNIGQCHLENLGSRDGILKAKTEIFDFMQEDGEICLNGDDDKLATVTEVRGKKTHFFGLGRNGAEEVYADGIVSKGLWGSDAMLHMEPGRPEQDLQINVPLPGVHMVANAAAAACVAKLLGLSMQEITEGIAKVQAVGGRTHLIRLPGYTVIDDCYNANPVSMKAAIDLLVMARTDDAAATGQRGTEAERIAILGDMFELGEHSDALHGDVGRHAVKSGIEKIICVGENSRHMYEAAVSAGKDKSDERNDACTILYFANREQLLQALTERTEELLPKGSTILVKASHGMGFAEVVERLTQNILSCF